eukprot:scaffold273517_cov23-Tisochrysis_lutea.AAC.1
MQASEKPSGLVGSGELCLPGGTKRRHFSGERRSAALAQGHMSASCLHGQMASSSEKRLPNSPLALMACLSWGTTSRVSLSNRLSSRLVLASTAEGSTPREQQRR